MKKNDLAKMMAQKAKITERFATYLINGGRNASPKMAIHLEKTLGVDRRCWVWPEDFPNPLFKGSEQPVQHQHLNKHTVNTY